ncbi:unnamed protein product [Protopolystoma xenopodis]|uniref:Uncharacterized protein n=1 Tax=Protopolystoma xenopodis TaxID=117903 RepID=A0A448WKZ7_9PLAT|nr:unnamed protein product [Protopolystoma xenopodis]
MDLASIVPSQMHLTRPIPEITLQLAPDLVRSAVSGFTHASSAPNPGEASVMCEEAGSTPTGFRRRLLPPEPKPNRYSCPSEIGRNSQVFNYSSIQNGEIFGFK